MNEQASGIAKVYAESILHLAEEQGEAEELQAELDELVVLLDREPELADFLTSPLSEADRKRQAIETLLRGRASDLLTDALQVINRKGRLGLVRAIAEAYRSQLEALRGLARVEVATAVPLDDDLRRRLERAAEAYTGRRAALTERVDPDLIGGVVVKVGDRKIDSSIAGELRKLHHRLMDRASREIHGNRDYVTEQG